MITITFEKLNPVTGNLVTYQEHFEPLGRDEQGRNLFQEVHLDSAGEPIRSTTSMLWMSETEDQLREEITALLEDRFASAVRLSQEARDQELRAAEYGEKYRDKVLAALDGLDAKDAILELLQFGVENYNSLERLAEIAALSKKDLRKILRDAYTAAKQSARDNYPEEYRAEDDKADFYEMFFDDMADIFAMHL